MTRALPVDLRVRSMRWFIAVTTLVAVLVPVLNAPSAHASDPLTFSHLAGLPRHQTPESVAVDASGNVYVTESAVSSTTTGDRVVKYDSTGAFEDVLAGSGIGAGVVANPSSVAVAADGTVYVVEDGYGAGTGATNEVSYYDALGNYLGSWGGYGVGNGQFKQPQGIAVDSLGNVYVADYGNDRIQKFTSSGGYVGAWVSNNVVEVALDAADRAWTVGGNTVSRYTSGGTLLNSWSASGATGVSIDTAGNGWVSSASAGTVRQFDSSGTLLATVGSGVLSAPEGLDVTSDGALYVADTGNGRVVLYSTMMLETSWSVSGVRGVTLDGASVVATDGGNVRTYSTSGAPGTSWASDGAYGVAVDGSGNTWASSTVDDVVRQYDSSGSLLQTIGSGDLTDPKGIALSGGDIFVADTGNGRIVRYAVDGTFGTSWAVTGVVDVAVGGSTVYATDGSNVRRYTTSGASAGTAWSSSGAAGITVDGSGNVWVSSSAGRVSEYTSTGTFVLSVGSGELTDPRGVAVGGGKVYVADAGADEVKRFPTVPAYQLQWGEYPAPGVEDYPTGVAADAAGNLYVTNKSQDVIQKFDASGNFVDQFGGTGSTNGLFQNPAAIAVAPSGAIYVADTTNQRIQKFDADFNYLMQWGSFGTADGMFSDPSGIAVDASGDVFVADTANHRIQKFDANGTFIMKWGAQGSGDSLFKSPHGLTVTGGSVWVADTGNNQVKSYTTSGVFQARWGSTGTGDGQLKGPYDVAIDAEGTVWVAERDNDRIQRFTTAGVFLSNMGSLGVDTGEFDDPLGLEVDSGGRVNVADANNHRVQVFIDANGPDVTFSSGPGTSTQLTSATFTFSANEPGATFECKLDDGGSWASCSSPKTYTSLAEGPHTVSVRGTDTDGNTGNPSTYSWSVDVTPPTASITSGPASPSASTSPSFSFASSEAGSTFLCQLDGGTQATCSSPKSVSVTNGSHTFKVWSIDPAGNQSTTAASYTWTVDTTPPNVTIDSGPSGWVGSTDATFQFSSGDAGATFECKLDGGSFAACTSPKQYSGLAVGQHTFAVRGIDDLGNISTEKTRTWTIDMDDHRPDALISTGTTYVGNKVYNTTGSNQTKTAKKGVGASAIFTLRFENDGSDTDVYTIQGPGSVKGYSVGYWIGTTSYTTKVTSGTLKFTLDPGEFKTLTLRVKVGSTGKSSASFLVKATSQHDATKVDAVKAVVKRV